MCRAKVVVLKRCHSQGCHKRLIFYIHPTLLYPWVVLQEVKKFELVVCVSSGIIVCLTSVENKGGRREKRDTSFLVAP